MKKISSILSLINKSETAFLLVVGMTSIVLAFVFFGINLKAGMGIIDDHTYVESGVLDDSSLVWKGFVNAPEIQSFGNSPRFRIIYNLINSAQTALWGLNASYWYLINNLVFAFFVFSVFFVTYKNLGKRWAALFTFFVISPIYFAHIFTRLGTAEVWTILGLSIFSLGLNSLYRKARKPELFNSWKEWFAMIFGSIILIGSKENFAVLGVLIVAFALFLKYKKRLNGTALFSSIFILALNGYQILDIFLNQKKQGVDFYQNNTGIMYRLTKLAEGAFSENALFFSLPFILFILALFVFFCIYKHKKNIEIKSIFKDPGVIKLFLTPLILSFILAIFYLFNLYMYDGISYFSHRYAFPSILVIQILFLIVIKWFFDLKSYYFPQREFRFRNYLFLAILIILLVFVAKNVDYSQKMSQKNVQATVLFQGELKSMVGEIKNHPDYPVVFSSYRPLDYEPLISASAYLRYYGIKNKLMVKTYYDLMQADSLPVEKWVADENIKFEKNGGSNFSSYHIDEDKKCFFIDFSGITLDEKCDNLGKIWQLADYPY